jgi:hypothetical protein
MANIEYGQLSLANMHRNYYGTNINKLLIFNQENPMCKEVLSEKKRGLSVFC